MKIAGIAAEYNPFHKGHELHIARTRELLGEDTAIVCVMSGNFTQRGEPAIFEKHVRAAAALRGGANLVLELPAAYALSSAERFARGAVEVLNSLGCVTHLSFGCESGSIDELREAAKLLSDPALGELIRSEAKGGVSFAEARQKALERMTGRSFELLKRPNNILAVEYIKALNAIGSDIEPVAVARRGAQHDEPAGSGSVLSASAIREKIIRGEDFSEYMPFEAYELFKTAALRGRGPVTAEKIEQSVLTRLRGMTAEEYERLPDMSEGLHLRLMRAGRSCGSLSEIYEAVKTKRYALSRIRRAVMCAWLGISAEEALSPIGYARVLAADGIGRAVLKQAGKNVCVITKPASARRLDEQGRKMFETEARATDLYTLGFDNEENRGGGQEWEISPVIE